MSREQHRKHPLVRWAATVMTASVAISTTVWGCGQGNAIVGGECATGYVQCGLTCVLLASDPNNCGACGNACAPGGSCASGTCVGGSLDGSMDATVDSSGDARLDSTTDGTLDSARDGSLDASTETTTDGMTDATIDVAGDVAGDVSVDAGLDAMFDALGDGTVDAVGDVTGDVVNDGSSDASPDGSTDAASDALSEGGADAGADAPTDVTVGEGGDSSSIDGAATDASADACVAPFNTVQHCGSCANACTTMGATCVQSDAGTYSCNANCMAPLVQCGQICVNEGSDSQNCGTCGKTCPSNLCSGGLCQGVTPGDDVVIGHDYATTLPGTAQARVVSDAVLLPSSNPLRILSFEHYANPVSVANVKAILNNTATAEGRALAITVTNTDSDIPNTLAITAYDVLIVYDQANATTGTLSALGMSWSSTLATFLHAGGDVVTLDGAAGAVQEMPQFETGSGLLAVTSHTQLTPGTALDVIAPGNSVGVGVLSPYGSGQNSTRFFTTVANANNSAYVVIEPVSGQPVVVHRIVP